MWFEQVADDAPDILPGIMFVNLVFIIIKKTYDILNLIPFQTSIQLYVFNIYIVLVNVNIVKNTIIFKYQLLY